jgi:Bacteriophage Lambda NinG protein
MLKRTSILRKADPTARASVPVHKPKKCAVKSCKAQFTPSRSFEVWCSPSCGLEIAQDKKRKAAEKAALAERKAHRSALADSKKLSHWVGLTERVVHAYIHARDRGLPCISCGTNSTVQWEAGHWLTKAARPELRFVAEQINLQCHRCNVQLSGNQAAYRIGLVQKIGEERVKELEGPHPAAKFTREQLAEMRAHYRALTKALNLEKA